MKYIHTLLLFLLIVLCLSVSKPLKAQNQRDKATKALNLHVEYINEIVHSMWILSNELRNFNATLNTYTNKNYDFSRSNYFSPAKSMKDILNETWYYEVLPEQMYAQCLSSTDLPIDVKNNLQPAFKDLHKTIEDLMSATDSIQKYIENKLYLQDDSLKWGYAVLERCSDYYDAYDVKKEAVYKAVSEVYTQKYPSKFPTQPFQKTAPQWMEFIVLAKAVFEEVRYSKLETIDIQQETTQLEAMLNVLIAKKEENIAGLTRYGESNGLDPGGRYQHCIWSAQAIVAHCQSYITAKQESQYYYGHSKQYNYYNEKFLNKYNRYGLGLARDYNEFVELCSEPLLKMAEEPHWFEVLYPPKKEPQQEPKQTTTTTNNGFSLENAAPNNLIFLLDVSGSMNAPEKFPLLKDAFKFLLTLMRKEDYVSIVTYSGTAKVALSPTSAQYKNKIATTIDSLYSSGSTNATQGLDLAYQVAEKNFITKGNNRIILATDGIFEMDKQTFQQIETAADKGLILTVLYLGKKPDDKTEKKLSKISQSGKGSFYHITSENSHESLVKEAKHIF
jgi:Ca-activated chloride channel homolog